MDGVLKMELNIGNLLIAGVVSGEKMVNLWFKGHFKLKRGNDTATIESFGESS